MAKGIAHGLCTDITDNCRLSQIRVQFADVGWAAPTTLVQVGVPGEKGTG